MLESWPPATSMSRYPRPTMRPRSEWETFTVWMRDRRAWRWVRLRIPARYHTAVEVTA